MKFAKSRYREEFLALARGVGHAVPSAFESRVVPSCLHDRDVAVEIPEGEDITKALILPCLREARGGTGPSAILVSSSESVRNISRQARAFSLNRARPFYTVALGIDDNIKKELQYLARPATIIVGTPERIIDHIRRDNVSLDSVERIVIELPEDYDESGFDKDILFIYSKLTKKVQTILFHSSTDSTIPLASILRHPLILAAKESEAPGISYIRYRTTDEEAKPKLLADLFFAEELMDGAIVCRTPQAASMLVQQLSVEGIKTKLLRDNIEEAQAAAVAEELKAGKIRAVVTESFGAVLQLPTIKVLVFCQVPDDVHDYAQVKLRLAAAGSCAKVITLAGKNESNLLTGNQEVQSVDTNNSPSSEDVLKGKIRSIVKRIKEDQDPAELNRLRSLIRKNVPVFLRGYFMAYMLRESFGKQPEVSGETKTLFVSVGKNRKVFPRDLSRLFSGALNIKTSVIGNIKVLDNYSFIDIPESLADKAISLLDGSDFRGRKITVNHARKKDEE